MAKLRFPSVYRRFVAFSNRFRKRRAKSDNIKDSLSGQNSVSSASTRPSSAALETSSDHGDDRIDHSRTPSRLSLSTMKQSSQPKLVVGEISDSPSEAGAEVSLIKKKRSYVLFRLASMALSKVSGSSKLHGQVEKSNVAKADCSEDSHHELPNRSTTLSLSQNENGPSVAARASLEIFDPLEDHKLGHHPPVQHTIEPPACSRLNADTLSYGESLEPAITESNALLANLLLGDSNILETATLADSLTSDDDSVGSIERDHLGDPEPQMVPIEADQVPGDMPKSSEIEMAEAEEQGNLDAGQPAEKSVVQDPLLKLRQFKERLVQQARATEKDLDILGCEIKYEHKDEAIALARHTSALSTASSILIDQRPSKQINRHSSNANCTEHCDCLGAANYEDGSQSIEYSQGSSILTDEEGDEFSEESVPTCYVCLQSGRRGLIWQDLK